MSIRLKFRVVSLCIVVIMVAVVLVGYWVASVEITRKVHNNLNLVADLELQRVNEVLDRNFERLSPRKQRRVFVRLKPSYDQAIQHIVIRLEFLFAPDIDFNIAFVRHRSVSTRIS